MRLTERKLAILTGAFFAAAMTNISQNGDRIVADLAKMSARPQSVVDTSAMIARGTSGAAHAGATVLSARQEAANTSARLAEPELTIHMKTANFASPETSGTGLRVAALDLPPDNPVSPMPLHKLDLTSRLATLDPPRDHPPSDSEMHLSPYGTPCAVALRATVRPGAMVSLSLDAPCEAGQRVEISHGALDFADQTTNYGRLSLLVPALAATATYTARFGDGQTASATVEVPAVAHVDRVILQWAGPVELNLHALEFGADENSSGHVWAGAARNAALAARAGGGFMVALGNPDVARPIRAEIYTLDHGANTKSGAVRMMIEAHGGAGACAQPVDALTLRATEGRNPDPMDIRFDMPPCGEPGQTLLLNNALQDLKIAQN